MLLLAAVQVTLVVRCQLAVVHAARRGGTRWGGVDRPER